MVTLEEIKDALEKVGIDSRIVEVSKGGIVKKGISVVIPSLNLCPTFYFDKFPGSVGEAVGVIFEQIVNAEFPEFDWGDLINWDNAKQHITVSLRPVVKDDCLARNWYDLQVVVRYFNENGVSCLIKNGLLSYWGVDEDTIFETAYANTRASLVYDSLTDVLKNLVKSMYGEASARLEELEKEDINPELVVITTPNKVYGSGALLFPDLLKEISDKYGTDLYLFPSSIHDIVTCPVYASSREAKLAMYQFYKGMVSQISNTEVAPEERLSNHPYIYSRQANEVICLNDGEIDAFMTNPSR